MEPIEFFTIVGSAAAVLGILIAWMTRRFDKLDDEIKKVSEDSNLKWLGAMQRSDQISSRIDTTQGIIMRMLEKQGK